MLRGCGGAVAALILALCSMSMTSAAKLYFRFGCVSSAKTLNLLAMAHSFRRQQKAVLLMKPTLDDRFGTQNIQSRAGLLQPADYLLGSTTDILSLPIKKGSVECIFVDEAQFLQPDQVDQLRMATVKWNTSVFCYGLRTDFRSNLFPGSRRLLEVADSVEEVQTGCQYCSNKAVLNLKHVNGVANTEGPTVQLGAEEKYYPVCFSCYRTQLLKSGQVPVEAWKDGSSFTPTSIPSTPYISPTAN